MRVLFFAVSGPTFMKFRDPRSFQRSCPIVSIMFLAGDSGPQNCYWIAKSSKVGDSGLPNFVGVNPQKSLRCVLLRTEARHVLKFRKNSFRGVDGLNYPLAKSSSGPKFLRGRGPKMFTAVCYRSLSTTVWQSLIEFCRLKLAKPGQEEKRKIFGGWVK